MTVCRETEALRYPSAGAQLKVPPGQQRSPVVSKWCDISASHDVRRSPLRPGDGRKRVIGVTRVAAGDGAHGGGGGGSDSRQGNQLHSDQSRILSPNELRFCLYLPC